MKAAKDMAYCIKFTSQEESKNRSLEADETRMKAKVYTNTTDSRRH